MEAFKSVSKDIKPGKGTKEKPSQEDLYVAARQQKRVKDIVKDVLGGENQLKKYRRPQK